MKHTLYILLLAPLLAAVTACSSDDFAYEGAREDDGATVSLSMSAGGWIDGRPNNTTRAAAPTDVTSCTALQPANIGVWGYYMTPGAYGDISKIADPIPNDYKVYDQQHTPHKYEGENPDTHKPYYQTLTNYLLSNHPEHPSHDNPATSSNHYTVGSDDVYNQTGSFPWEAQEYMFYCYAPHQSVIRAEQEALPEEQRFSATLTPAPAANAGAFDPATMTTLTLTNVPSVSAHDIVVAKKRRSWDRTAGSCVNFVDDAYALEHIYSALQFCFALDAKYAEIRYLHIKDVKLTTMEAEGSTDMTTFTVTKNIKSGTEAAFSTPVTTSSIENVAHIGWGGDGDFLLGKATNPSEGMVAEHYYAYSSLFFRPQENQQIGSPANTPKQFRLVVTYDVYDRTGLCTRQNATASSVLTFPRNTLKGPGDTASNTFLPGYYYNVFIKINPDFLYVLSDNDASADVIITGSK